MKKWKTTKLVSGGCRHLLIIFFLLSFLPDLYSQKNISGKVTDLNGNPLVGVSVIEKTTNVGTTTDVNGSYKLKISNENNPLIFSMVGFVSAEKKVEGEILNVSLQNDISGLDEVVVVGFGTQKKSELTASISTIDESQIKDKFFTNSTEALRGAKGVYVFSPGAQPGKGEVTINIRGQGTLNNNNPLVLVDGVEYDMGNVDPNNIKSISVLKDAASAAIYGARAANGVILVTTKGGAGAEGMNLSYDNYFGYSKAINLPQYSLEPIEWFELFNQAEKNAGKTVFTFSDDFIEDYREGMKSDPLLYPSNTDWYKLGLRKGFVQKHNVRLYGSSDLIDYSLSVGYNEQEGTLIGTGANKYPVNLNTGIKLNDKMKINVIFDGQLNKYYEPVGGAGYLMDQLNREAGIPYDIIYTKDGNYADNWFIAPGHGQVRNPYGVAREGYNRHKEQSYRLSLGMDYKLPLGINYSLVYAYVKQDNLQQIFEPEVLRYNPITNMPIGPLAITQLTKRRAESFSTWNYQNNFQQTLDWEKHVGKSNLFFLLGQSLQMNNNNNFFAVKEGFLDNTLTSLNAGVMPTDAGGTFDKATLSSVFARARYNYLGKYLFEADFRADGSSNFAVGHKWGGFPSFSAGWLLSKENFMSNIDWINSLKLRASWGQLGNNRIDPYRYINLITLGQDYSFGNQLTSGAAVTNFNDPTITWEKTALSNVGIDGTLFKNKIDFSIEFYNKKTSDILHAVELPAQIGDLGGPIRNIGVVNNSGIELNINYRDQIGDFHYSVGGNLSTVKNKVVSINGERIFTSGWRGRGGTIIAEGYPIDSYYLLHAEGIFQTKDEIDAHAFQGNNTIPGYLKFEDVTPDGTIDENDRIISKKSRIPRVTYSFNIDLSYKHFRLSAWFTGVSSVYSYSDYYGMVPFWFGSGVTDYWLKNAWSPENTKGTLPIITTYSDGLNTNFRNSDFLLHNSSYLRLKNVTLSYELPKGVLTGAKIKSAEIFLSGDNLVTFSPLPYYDPEKDLSDATFTGYPTSLTLTGGIRVVF